MAHDAENKLQGAGEDVVHQFEEIGENTTDRERLQAEGAAPPANGALQGRQVTQEAARTQGSLDIVQEASEESFPASDPPGYTRETKESPPDRE